MSIKKSNNLILIENGKINTYRLDNRLTWELGRVSGNNMPDIRCYSLTVSRKHGSFQNMDGVWFYVDCYGKNGTVYAGKKLKPAAKGRIKPIMLKDGDVFVFGGGEEAVIGPKTAWALFKTKEIGDDWRLIDTKGCTNFEFTDGKSTTKLENISKGTVIETDKGMAIYMDDITFLMGEMDVVYH